MTLKSYLSYGTSLVRRHRNMRISRIYLWRHLPAARYSFGLKFTGNRGAALAYLPMWTGGGSVVLRSKLCLAGTRAQSHPLNHSDQIYVCIKIHTGILSSDLTQDQMQNLNIKHAVFSEIFFHEQFVFISKCTKSPPPSHPTPLPRHRVTRPSHRKTGILCDSQIRHVGFLRCAQSGAGAGGSE